ncbi:MAG: T9SS type A sorting domain-containing protein [Chlorobi bacterium]|nr:T9SS type A sorting domain-containing protein [Chlorobiota bacterium]
MKIKSLFIYILIVLCVVFNKVQAQTEAEIVSAMYSGSSDLVDLTDDLISYAVRAVWEASVLTSTKTTTGTLTQSTANNDDWTYSASPEDKLILVFSSGETMSFKFTTISGYTEGTVDDFIDSHSMDFISEVPNELNLKIVSDIGLNSNTDNTEWNRTINGTSILNGITYKVNVTYSGAKHADLGYSFALYDYTEKTSGTVNSPSVKYTVNESYTSHSAANSNKGTYAQDRWNINNNSAQTTTASYGFSNAYCKWHSWTSGADSAFAVVNEPYRWEAGGKLLKNNQEYGNVRFDRAIIEGTYGPFLIVRCSNGEDYLLSKLLNLFVNDIESQSIRIKLVQNYPNPFSLNTMISYQLQESGKVTLKVFDTLGKEVAILVNKIQPAGSYKVNFDASRLPDGNYICRLVVNDFVQVKKMIKLR